MAPPQRHGGGSNIPVWTQDGALLAACRLPASNVPWQFQAQRPDLDHFNRDFLPQQAKGGTHICRLELDGTTSTALTNGKDGIWDFRQSESPDATQLLFCRAPSGDSPSIWLANAQGQQAQPLTKGWDNLGADHPRWMPLPLSS